MFSKESGLFFINQLQWLEKHAKFDSQVGEFVCRTSGAFIQSTLVVRAFQDDRDQTIGTCWPVHHMYCPVHTAPACVCPFDPVRIQQVIPKSMPRA